MRRLLTTLVFALALCVGAQPAAARMKPVAAGKVESAAERRKRILKQREEARKTQEQAQRLAQEKKEQEERETQRRQEREERAARVSAERAAAEARLAEAQAAEQEAQRRVQREKEQEATRLAEEKERREEKLKEDISFAGLDVGWKKLKGLMQVDESLQLQRPMVIFLHAEDARRHLIWGRSDGDAACQHALECVRKQEAHLLPKGTKLLVSFCEEEDEDDCDPLETLFYVTTTDGTEGWVTNPILRQHRVVQKKKRRGK